MISYLKKIPGAIIHPVRILRYASRRGYLKWLHDESYIKLIFRMQVGYPLDFNNPKTFNEKLQWLKINERRAIYTAMVDKIASKTYVANLIGQDYIIPTLGVWENANQIEFDSLPNQFVLKCNHDSSSVIICEDKNTLNRSEAIKKLNYCLKNNGYWSGREWPYKNVKPLVFAEKYMEDHESANRGLKSLNVYKFLTFNGEPKIIQTIQNDKRPDESIDYFDCSWNLLDMRQNFPNSKDHLPRPKNLDLMIELARELAQGTYFVRVDLYEVNGKVYFSEYTFFSDDGMNRFTPDHWDKDLGDLIRL